MKYFILAILATFLFCIAIGFDISPYLRGPAPYPPEWRWEYYFVNTFSKIYLPTIIGFLIIELFWIIEKKKFLITRTKTLLLVLITLSFFFQLSVLDFSRSGVPVLIHRIINPELNSYFTASLLIQDPIDFLKNYDQYLSHFVYHARSHPPGAVLIYYLVKQFISPFTFFIDFTNSLNPGHADVKQLWNLLLPINKATAIFSAFFIPLLSTLTLIPLYYSAKILYGTKVAIRSAFLFIFIPSIVLFIPINDVFLPLFSISSFLFLIKGLKENKNKHFFISGLILFLGIFFSLSLLPLLLLFTIYSVFKIRKDKFKKYINPILHFSIGFSLLPISFYLLFNFNFILLIQTIMNEVVHVHTRSYTTWIFYNLYDFFVFTGIAISTIFFALIKKFDKSDILFVSFLIFIIIVNLSGSTRGETGRIWSPYLPFIILPVVAFLTDKLKFSSKFFIGVLLLQGIQIIIMQEFWVILW